MNKITTKKSFGKPTAKQVGSSTNKTLNSFLYFVGLLIVVGYTYAYIFDAKLFLGGDNANYYVLAKSLANGEGYTNFHMPGMRPANHFPPGYSFIMSLVMRLGIDSINAMKILNGVLLFCFSLTFFKLSSKLTKNTLLSFVVTCLVLLNKHILEYSTIMMSEISFLLFSTLSVLLFLKVKSDNYKLKSIWFILLILAVTSSIYIRTQGITLVCAFAVMTIIEKKYLFFSVTLIGIFLLLAPWQMRSSNLGGNAYTKQLLKVNPYSPDSPKMDFSHWVKRFGKNTKRYVSKEIPTSMFPSVQVKYVNAQTGKLIPSTLKNWLIGIFSIILVILGIWHCKKYRLLMYAFFVSTLGILLLWPDVWFGVRFFIPLIPFSILFFILGIYFLLGLIIKKKQVLNSPKIAIAFSLFALVNVKPIQQLKQKKEGKNAPNWENFLDVAEWSRKNLKEDAVITSRKPTIFYVKSRRKVSGFPSTPNRNEVLDYFDENGITHVVLEQLGFQQTAKYLAPVVQAENQKFKLVYSLGATIKKDKNGKEIPITKGVWLYEYNPEFGYSGEYKNGKRDGKGVFKTKNGHLIDGMWKQDTLHGVGKYINPDKTIFEGKWEKGKKDGKFYIIKPDSTIYEAYYKNDVMKKDGFLVNKERKRIKAIKF